MDRKRLNELCDKLIEPGSQWTSSDCDELLNGLIKDRPSVVHFCDRLEIWQEERQQTRERCESVFAKIEKAVSLHLCRREPL